MPHSLPPPVPEPKAVFHFGDRLADITPPTTCEVKARVAMVDYGTLKSAALFRGLPQLVISHYIRHLTTILRKLNVNFEQLDLVHAIVAYTCGFRVVGLPDDIRDQLDAWGGCFDTDRPKSVTGRTINGASGDASTRDERRGIEGVGSGDSDTPAAASSAEPAAQEGTRGGASPEVRLDAVGD